MANHMTDPSIWNQLLIWPILNILFGIYKVFAAIGLPGSLGLAIIGLTVLIRLALYPLTAAQLKSTQQMQELKPHMDRIRQKYKKDKMRQQQEMAKLYKEYGVNPAAGCLPLLVQIPIFIALYNVLLTIVSQGDIVKTTEEINKIVYAPFLRIDKPWDPNFLGINLGARPSDWQQVGIVLLAVPIVTGILQFVQTKMMIPKAQEALVEKAAADKKVDSSDFANIMQKQMLYFFPVMIAFVSYTFPIGLSLYWNAFSVFGIIQQYLFMRNRKKQVAK